MGEEEAEEGPGVALVLPVILTSLKKRMCEVRNENTIRTIQHCCTPSPLDAPSKIATLVPLRHTNVLLSKTSYKKI